VCGAGDTFLASLVYGYLSKDGDIEAAIKLANYCSAWSVDQAGVVSITPEVKEELGIE
jgi:sugar/nucleoside kinase (ribokinase family)